MKKKFSLFSIQLPIAFSYFSWVVSTYHNKAWSSCSAGACLPNTLSIDIDFKESLVKKVGVDE